MSDSVYIAVAPASRHGITLGRELTRATACPAAVANEDPSDTLAEAPEFNLVFLAVRSLWCGRVGVVGR